MKKGLLIGTLLISSFAFAQDSNKGQLVYSTNSSYLSNEEDSDLFIYENYNEINTESFQNGDKTYSLLMTKRLVVRTDNEVTNKTTSEYQKLKYLSLKDIGSDKVLLQDFYDKAKYELENDLVFSNLQEKEIKEATESLRKEMRLSYVDTVSQYFESDWFKGHLTDKGEVVCVFGSEIKQKALTYKVYSRMRCGEDKK